MLAGVTLEGAHEYAIALFLLIAGAISLSFSVFHWTGIIDFPRLTKVTRVIIFIIGLICIPVSVIWIFNAKADNQWSRLIKPSTILVTTTSTFTSTTLSTTRPTTTSLLSPTTSIGSSKEKAQIVTAQWSEDFTFSAAVVTGRCIFHGITIRTDGTNDVTFTIYDGITASGKNVLFPKSQIISGTAWNKTPYAAGQTPGILMKTGIYVSVSVAGGGLVTYKIQYEQLDHISSSTPSTTPSTVIPKQPIAKETKESIAQKATSFEKLFKSDFNKYLRQSGEDTFVTENKEGKRSLRVLHELCYDFESKSKFLDFTFPHPPIHINYVFFYQKNAKR